mgnify:CR=1 FL=1
MSVQLVVYPQSYEGQYSTYSVPFFSQYVSDYSFNAGANGSGYSLTVANPVDTVMANVAPNNLWNSWNTTGGIWGVTTAPAFASGKVTLDSAASDSNSGIFQLISNLVIGSTYEVKVEILAGTTGIIVLGHSSSWTYSGTTYEPILFTAFVPSVSTQTFTFTATNSDMVFILAYANDDNTNLEVGSISITENLGSAPLVDEYTDGQVILDLYEESNIPLSLSVDNFKNVAEKSQSYSKAFKLPSTKRNNKIFSSLYDITRSVKSDVYAFNPYVKTKAILKEDGYTIFDGYLRLIDISEKDEEVSYNVNLYGDTITLADTLKDKKFKDIDFSELAHTYDKANIKLSFYDNNGVVLTTALPTSSFAYTAALGTGKTDVIKYPFVKWNGDSYLDSGNVVLEKLEDAFRPFINCKYLVDRIITEAGFTYNSDFLESTDFTKLFMDFNWGSDNTPNVSGIGSDTAISGSSSTFAATSYTTIPIDIWYSSLGTISTITQFNTTSNQFVADANTQNYSISYNITLENTHTGNCVVNVRWVHKDSGGTELNEIDLTTQTIAASSTYDYIGNFTELLNSGDTLEVQFLSDIASKVRLEDGQLSNMVISVSLSLANVVTTGALTTLRGDLGQWDFLKGLLTMFNLMVLQDKDNPANLIIEPYKSVFLDDSLSQYITHTTHDWTNKVDVSEMKLTPLKLKKKVLFDFVKEDKDYATEIYKNATGYKYGSQEIDASEFNLLEGETKVEAKPFGSTFVKPIFDGFTSEMTIPVIYAGKEDGSFEGFENKPRILYNIGRITMASNTYYIPEQNGLNSENQGSYLQFSHLTETPTTASTKDYHFNTGQLIGSIGNTPVANLFNEYWSPYYDELYNPDTKEVKLKVYLNPSDISNFNFYDKVLIKNREYRVNKIDYKPYELSTVELILI